MYAWLTMKGKNCLEVCAELFGPRISRACTRIEGAPGERNSGDHGRIEPDAPDMNPHTKLWATTTFKIYLLFVNLWWH